VTPMPDTARDPLVELVLVFAPIGRDGELSAQILQRAGLWTKTCGTLEDLCKAVEAGAAVAIVTEEALSAEALERVSTVLAGQPKWSDLPIVLCSTGGDVARVNALRARALDGLGNAMVIERPMQTRTLLAAVHAGLRARRRQLALRDVVVELERSRSEAEEANRTKDEFLAMVSHELRTPLNAILGWSRMLTAGRLGEEQKARAITTIERNAVAQARLIDELLDVSRIISRKLRLSLRALDWRALVEATAHSMRPAAEAKGLTLAIVVDPEPLPIMGDSDRLAQVVSNLLGNAIKFTPSGGRIDVTLMHGEGGAAQLSVRDDGIGIREEFVPYVFDRFRQADGSRTRTHGGLGLGLAIVRHLVELHGGQVSVESEGVGKGTTMTVTIPLLAEGALGTRPSDRPAASAQPTLAGIHVVVVDDEQDARDLVTAVLEQAGAIVTSVGSVEEAMHAIAERPPSLLVSDIGMPGEDGYALIARLRALPAEAGGRVPAVAVTAFTRDDDRARALRAGFTAHVAKPIDPAELVTLVSNVTTRGALPPS
jgi:signal transduction histidine kinase/ActR/RegA family two-component response regulator